MDALFQQFRSTIFMPASLLAAQRNLIYRRKHWDLLTNPDEPATARIGHEVVRMVPLDRTKDEPPIRQSFLKALRIMRELDDWRNLPLFLEGLNMAKRQPEGDQLEKMIRWLVETGRRLEVLELVKQVERTGIGLWDTRVTREVMWGGPIKAAQLGWTRRSVETTVGYLDRVWAVMSDWKHSEHANVDGGPHPSRLPEINGVMLQMYAAQTRMMQQDDGTQTDKERGPTMTMPDALLQVQKWAARTFAQWDRLDVDTRDADWSDLNYKMCLWAPVWHGLKLAREVLGTTSPLAFVLEEKEKQLRGLLDHARAVVVRHTPGSVESVEGAEGESVEAEVAEGTEAAAGEGAEVQVHVQSAEAGEGEGEGEAVRKEEAKGRGQVKERKRQRRGVEFYDGFAKFP